MIDLKEFATLKEQVELLKSKKDQAKGVVTQLKTELLEKYHCSTVKEAKALLQSLQEEQVIDEETYRAEFDALDLSQLDQQSSRNSSSSKASGKSRKGSTEEEHEET